LVESGISFLLRNVEDGEDSNQVVVPGYICSVMNGELWPDDDELGVKDSILV
jgi:hypothetical protein